MYISRHQMAFLYPNAFVVLRVLLTVPVSVASGVHILQAQTHQKLPALYYESRETLNGLAAISIEHELSYEINLQQACMHMLLLPGKPGESTCL